MTDEQLHATADKMVNIFRNDMKGQDANGSQLILLLSYVIIMILTFIGQNATPAAMLEIWRTTINHVGDTIFDLIKDLQKGGVRV
jgi:hypothetical protein